MKIERTSGKGAKQSFRVAVPASDMEKAVEASVEALARDAKLPGFRPGKAPMAVLRQRFGRQAEDLAVNEAVAAGVREALRQNGLAAFQVRIDGGPPGRGDDGALGFAFDVDAIPKIKLRPFARLQVEVPKAEPAEADIDAEVASLRLLCGKTEAAEEGYAAGEEDILDLDLFDRTGPEENAVAMAVTFDPPSFRSFWGRGAEVAGLQRGDDRTLEVTTPDRPDLALLAGRSIRLGVRVREVHRRTPASLDEVAGRLGLEDPDAVRAMVGDRLRGNFAGASERILWRRGLDALVEAHAFEIADDYLAQRTERALRERGQDPAGADPEALGAARAAVEGGIRATVLLDEVASEHGLEATSREVAELVAAALPQDVKDPQEEIRKRLADPDLLASVHRGILREKAFGLVLDGLRRAEVTVDGRELLRMAQEAGPPMVQPRRARPPEGAPAAARAG